MTGEDQSLERRPRQEIVASEFDVEGYARRLSPQLGQSVRTADILLLPTDFGEEHPGGYFPESTPAVLQHLRMHLPSEAAVEAALDDDEYAEYAYRSADLILPALVIQGQQVLSSVVISSSPTMSGRTLHSGHIAPPTSAPKSILRHPTAEASTSAMTAPRRPSKP